MESLHEQLSQQFYKWEERARGWQVFPEPVAPEPPFRPFPGHYLPNTPCIDDGHRPTVLGWLVQGLSRKLRTEPEAPPLIQEEEEEPQPVALERDSLVELQTFLPTDLKVSREDFEQFLFGLSLCHEPVAFELVGRAPNIAAQFAVHPADASLVKQQLQAFFPEAVFLHKEGTLEEAWRSTTKSNVAIVEFGLAREVMFTLATGRLDPFIGIIGAMEAMQTDELGLFQVIFQPVRHPWAESILRSVTDEEE
jgi:hypothetical protein